MGFLAPWFLAGAALIGVPLWLHLLQQHKTTPLPFSSLMFFERRTQSSVKHRRLKHLILMALRIALILLLALAFANLYRTTTSAAAAGRGRLIVAAIDNSFSMRQGTRLEQAKQGATRVLGPVGGDTRGVVLSFSHGVSVAQEATADRAALQAAVAGIQAGDGRGSFAELARTIRSIAQNAKVPVELHVFSDLQKTSWPTNFGDSRLGDGVTLAVHAMATKDLPNFAVETVRAPRRIYDPKKVRIQATVAGYGTPESTKQVSLWLNGKQVESREVKVAAGGRGSVEFLTLDAPYGLNKAEIHISPPDEFAEDDRFYFSAERADPRHVLFLHESRNNRDLLYFRTALDAANDGAFSLESVPVEQTGNLSFSKYALIVVSDLSQMPEALESKLKDYVQAGGALWIALGHFSSMRKVVPVYDTAITETRYSPREGERFRTVSYHDPGHPAVERVRHWESVKFYQSVRIDPAGGRVVAKLSDNTPLLVEKAMGEGRVMVFASTFDNVSNDFPLHASFVPFVVETARYLGRIDDGSSSVPVGAFVDLRKSGDERAAAEVLDPSGKRAMTLSEAQKAQSLALDTQGFYDVRRPSGDHELVAVNPDRKESDFAMLSAETLQLWKNTGQAETAAGAGGTEKLEERKDPLWWYIMLALMVVVLAESWIGNRHLSAREA